MAIEIARARDVDFDRVRGLLAEYALPIDGLSDHLSTLLVARDGDAIVGSAALEVYPDGALMRSVAITGPMQGRGLGRQLTEAVMAMAADLNLPALYLLTTTADRYFSKLGFEPINRSEVPASVTMSVEFRSACPSSAVAMRRIVGPPRT
jgi:amino-acid N-acetyltransferase